LPSMLHALFISTLARSRTLFIAMPWGCMLKLIVVPSRSHTLF
jgi:hypothetical protein